LVLSGPAGPESEDPESELESELESGLELELELESRLVLVPDSPLVPWVVMHGSQF
jgi:hypothetical protein